MRKIKCVNPSNPQAHRVYMVDGFDTTLSANGGGQGGKTGLYLVSNMDKTVLKTFAVNSRNKLIEETSSALELFSAFPLISKQD